MSGRIIPIAHIWVTTFQKDIWDLQRKIPQSAYKSNCIVGHYQLPEHHDKAISLFTRECWFPIKKRNISSKAMFIS